MSDPLSWHHLQKLHLQILPCWVLGFLYARGQSLGETNTSISNSCLKFSDHIIGLNLILNPVLHNSLDFFGNYRLFIYLFLVLQKKGLLYVFNMFSTILFQLQKVVPGTFRCTTPHLTVWLLSGILLVAVFRNTGSHISLPQEKAMNKW